MLPDMVEDMKSFQSTGSTNGLSYPFTSHVVAIDNIDGL